MARDRFFTSMFCRLMQVRQSLQGRHNIKWRFFFWPKSPLTSGSPPPPPAPQHKAELTCASSISREQVLTLTGCTLGADTGCDFFHSVLRNQVSSRQLFSNPDLELEILGLVTVSIRKASHMKFLLRGESRGIRCQIAAEQ